MILYMENPKDYTHAHSHTHTHTHTHTNGRTNKQIQQNFRTQSEETKLVLSLHTNKEQFENKIKRTIPLTLASKKDKILRNKLKQGVKRLVHYKLQIVAERN